jgi:hypothetical protein
MAREQLALVFDAPAPERVTYCRGLPDRSGTAHYTHLIRSPHDPPETKARGAKARETGDREIGYAKRLGTVDEWCTRILALLADGRPRTWNAIAVTLIGCTGDVLMGSAPERALWRLCEREEIAWTQEAPIEWTLASAIEWGAA